MKRFRPHRPSPAMVVALLALFVAMGGAGYAATQLPVNSVGSRQLKTDAVKSSKVKNGTLNSGDVKDNSLTGGDIDESRLGIVPGAINAFNAANATNAQNANNASNAQNATQLGGVAANNYAQRADLQPEAVHFVSAFNFSACAEEPGRFCPVWANYGNGFAAVGFRKDSGGFVHLQGVPTVNGAGIDTIFYLPTGYRPTDAKHQFIAQQCPSGSTTVDIGTDGSVTTASGVTCLSLDGITFHP